MQVKIRMMGVLREAKGLREVMLDVPEDSTVGSIIKALTGFVSIYRIQVNKYCSLSIKVAL